MNVSPEQLGALVAADMAAFQRAAVTEVAVQVLRGLVRPYPPSPGTPVDTGWHASGWRVGTPAAPTDALPEFAGSYTRPGDNEAVEGLRDWSPGAPFEVASNTGVPQVLEAGHSKQAPNGFAQQAIDGANGRMARWQYKGGLA